MRNNKLLFRADMPVKDNIMGAVVTLTAQLGLEKVLLPIYMRAAEMHAALRLYGALFFEPEPVPEGTPSVSFVTWKCHMPDEPDAMPGSLWAGITPHDQFLGYIVQSVKDPAKTSLLELVMEEFELQQQHPRSCVVIMHGFIELLVNTLLDSKCVGVVPLSPKLRDISHAGKLEILRNSQLLNDAEYKKLSWLRKVRNDAAHEVVFNIQTKNLDLFKGTPFEDAANFPLLCLDIFVRLWNKNKEVFSPTFYPSEALIEIKTRQASGGRAVRFQ